MNVEDLTSQLLRDCTPELQDLNGQVSELTCKLKALTWLLNPVVLAIGRSGSAVGEKIAASLNLPIYYIFIEPLHVPEKNGLIVGAAPCVFDNYSIDEDLLLEKGISADDILEKIQEAKQRALAHASCDQSKKLWLHHRENYDKASVFVVDASIVSAQVFNVLLNCLDTPGVENVIPVTPYLFKPAVMNANRSGKVRTGVYLHQYNDLDSLRQAVLALKKGRGQSGKSDIN